MRVGLAVLLVAGWWAVHPWWMATARAEPQTCPPVCDQIPHTAWLPARSIPLDAAYHWPAPSTIAVTLTGEAPGLRFRFEELCATPVLPEDPRKYAVVSQATVTHPDGQWQLHAHVLHWRGETARGGQVVAAVFNAAGILLRSCQLGAPTQSPAITIDQPNRLAAVLSGPVLMRTYLVAHPQSSTISELSLWALSPPQLAWSSTSADQVLDAMTAALCAAYVASCPW
ncbi:MAG: ATPase [Mycobacteriaceae bacterium]|nr:ATPase [Mycobacteriaceae bacterium]